MNENQSKHYFLVLDDDDTWGSLEGAHIWCVNERGWNDLYVGDTSPKNLAEEDILEKIPFTPIDQ